MEEQPRTPTLDAPVKYQSKYAAEEEDLDSDIEPLPVHRRRDPEYEVMLNTYERKCNMLFQKLKTEKHKFVSHDVAKYKDKIFDLQREVDDVHREKKELVKEYEANRAAYNNLKSEHDHYVSFFEEMKKLFKEMMMRYSQEMLFRETTLQLQAMERYIYDPKVYRNVVASDQTCYLCTYPFKSKESVTRRAVCCRAVIHSRCYNEIIDYKIKEVMSCQTLEDAKRCGNDLRVARCPICRKLSVEPFEAPALAISEVDAKEVDDLVDLALKRRKTTIKS